MDIGGRARSKWTRYAIIGHEVNLLQARYFKTMLKEYDHLDRVKRMKVSQKETEPLTGNYQVGDLNMDCV
jgi:hypothetical protein